MELNEGQLELLARSIVMSNGFLAIHSTADGWCVHLNPDSNEGCKAGTIAGCLEHVLAEHVDGGGQS